MQHSWTAPDRTKEQLDRIRAIDAELADMDKDIKPMFNSVADIDALTDDQAYTIYRYARRMLISQLLYQEYHYHNVDDCGDYLDAATQAWTHLHDAHFMNDGTDFTEHVKAWLKDKDSIGGCDGEIRYNLFTEGLMDAIYAHQANLDASYDPTIL